MLIIDKKNRKKMLMLLRFFSYKNKKEHIYIAKKSILNSKKISIDTGTRINGKIIIKGSGECKIGKYCAFGSDIKIITSNHNYKYINLQIALQLRIGAKYEEIIKNVEIKDNVWIGDNAIILPGVTIGKGAVIGAGSVVTKNIPSYSIAVGNPAKVIKYRFSKETQNFIDNLNWEDWDINEMKTKVDLFEKKYD